MNKYSRSEKQCNKDVCEQCWPDEETYQRCKEKNLVSINDIPFLFSDWISHADFGSDCCGVFNEVQKEEGSSPVKSDLFCNECGISLRSLLPNIKRKEIILKLTKDGNQYCVLIGKDLQEGIAGFGDTLQKAMEEFWNIWGNRLDDKYSMSKAYNFINGFSDNFPDKKAGEEYV